MDMVDGNEVVKLAHTPGPWKYEGTATSLHAIRDGAGVGIAQALHRRDKLEQYANARLIAAAPEMLAILQVLVASHPKDCACLGGCDFRIARGLVAKIEGKE